MPHIQVSNPTVEQTVASIAAIGRSKWIFHERALAERVGLSMEYLHGFMRCIGGRGPSPYNAEINLDSGNDNPLNLHRMKHGSHATQVGNINPNEHSPEHALTGASTYYQVGRRATHDTRINLNMQKEVIRMVTGTHSTLNQYGGDYKKRRQQIWKDWINGSNSTLSSLYDSDHLPWIALYYKNLWDVSITTDNPKEIPSAVLALIKKEIVELFICMFVIPPTSLKQFTVLRRSQRNSTDMEIEPVNARKRRCSTVSDNNSDAFDDSDDEGEDMSDNEKVMMKRLEKKSLRNLWNAGECKQVGSLEIAACGAHAREELQAVNAKIIKLGGTAISIADYNTLIGIPKSTLVRKMMNFNTLKMEHINPSLPPGMFQVGKDQLVLEYVNHGLRYTETGGECHTQDMFFKSIHNSQRELRLDCANMIRHIVASYDISLSKFPALLNCFACLLIGRPLKGTEYPSTATIRLHIPRLTIIDRHFASLVDRKTFGAKSKHGFDVLYYLVTDDTVHLTKKKHHGVLRTSAYEVDDDDIEDVFERPSRFITLTSESAVGENASANADLNMKVMVKEIHPDVLPFLGGGTVDGASSAQKEIEYTMDNLFEYCEREGIVYTRYGVKPRRIIIQDFFHIDNIAINGASVVFSGESERGNSRQFHPLQLLQSIHDIHSVDPVASQNIINDLLSDMGVKIYKLQTCRERPQRWRVNGLYALRILKMMAIKLANGESLLTAWAKEMEVVGGKATGPDSQWMKQAAKEILIMSRNQVIKISLAFEAELVSNYFDITNADHAKKGESDRSGFGTMGLPFLLLNFIVPFWRSAKKDPAKYFPRTAALIDELEDESLKRQKKEQLQAAVECGMEKVSKNTEQFFKAPLVFLLLPHPVEGPRILRMILRIFYFNDFEDFDYRECYYCNEHDDFDGDAKDLEWGMDNYRLTVDQLPDEEKVWYQILSEDKDSINDLAHYWQQLGFARYCIREELIRLSKVTESSRDPTSKHPIKDFEDEFPIICEALSAAFGFSASNSRIVEMLHSFARECIDNQTPTQFLSDKLRYKVDNCYRDREERRRVFRERADKSKPQQKAKHNDRSELIGMEGKQLMEASAKYDEGLLGRLPPDIQHDCKISTIRKNGTTCAEKEHAASSMEAWMAKRQKKLQKSSLIAIDDIQADADGMRTEHDKQWQDRATRKMNEVTKTVATKTHFRKVRMDDLFEEVANVLPYIELPEERITKQKLFEKGGILGNHLELIKKIAKNPSLNTITDDDLTEMSEDEILKFFVHASKSKRLEDIQRGIDDKRKLLNDVFDVAAKEISPHFQVLLKKSTTQGDDEIWLRINDTADDDEEEEEAANDDDTNNDSNA